MCVCASVRQGGLCILTPPRTPPRLQPLPSALYAANSIPTPSPLRVQVAQVVLKQNSARFYRISTFVFVDTAVRVPLAAAEILVFGTLVYW